MSLAGLRKPSNFAGWDGHRDIVGKMKETLISWSEDGGVFSDNTEESDFYQLYDSRGNSLSDLVNQELLRIGDVASTESSQAERGGEIEPAQVTLSFKRRRSDGLLWCKVRELARLMEADTGEMMEALGQHNFTVGPKTAVRLTCLPDLFMKMKVRGEIFDEATKQIKNIRI